MVKAKANAGVPVPVDQRNFIVEKALADRSLTDRRLAEIASDVYNRLLDESTVGKIRRAAEILSSRKFISLSTVRPALTSDQRTCVSGLLSKITLPGPDSVRYSDLVTSTGRGIVGPNWSPIWVDVRDRELRYCWLNEQELFNIKKMLRSESLVKSLDELMAHGCRVLRKVLALNFRIDRGSGETTFWEVIQLLETTNPEQLNSSDRDTHSLWLDYQQLHIEIERFKQLVSEDIAPVI